MNNERLAINPKYDKLITSLQIAKAREHSLLKEETSH